MTDSLAIRGAARLLLAFLAAVVLGSCGSGAVSSNTANGPSTAITLSPASATLYSDLPATFVVTGGNGNYLVVSSDQLVVPIAASTSANTFTVVPGEVGADTTVTLTVRDTGTAAPVNAQLTVKPRTVSNVVTVTPSSSQSAACGAAICAGGDAEVKVVLTQAGTPLSGRQVRFDVVSGDFGIITSAPGLPEVLSLSGTSVTDTTGTARIRIRALASAAAQTALLQITDASSGASVGTPLSIAPSSNAPLSALPPTLSFVGPDSNTCASNIAADVIVFGGRPPYQVTNPGTFMVTPTFLTNSGDRFTVTANGSCTQGSPIAIVDNNGASVTVNASNETGALTTTTPPLVVSPTSVTLETCTSIATIAVAGGVPPYFSASSTRSILTSATTRPGGGGGVSIQRRIGSPLVTTNPQTVSISDGRTVQDVTVNLVGPGAGPC